MRNASPCRKTFEVLCTILDLCDLLKQHLWEAEFTELLSMAFQSVPRHHFQDLTVCSGSPGQADTFILVPRCHTLT